MIRRLVTRFVVIGVLLGAGVAAARPLRASTPSQEGEGEGQAVIASPQYNETISGVVQITGTAIDPAFSFYQLEYALNPPQGEESWFPIQPPVAQQVRDGVLGIWDTTLVVDAEYVLRLRVIRSDETVIEDQVRVRVANATATPLPTLPPPPSPTPEPGTPTPGPSPTPLIQQPPTRTPRPTATPGGPTPTPIPPAADEDSPFRPEALRRAALRGALGALAVFGLLGLYGLFRAARRGQLRVTLWRFRREVINPLINSLSRRRK
ncbi:MAG TPA: hypothetical protein ENI95_00090 [Chloroflexi bacterium]|nr:hypothetical protein [Chloroflexota bacterium]